MQILLRYCVCGHNNLQHSPKFIRPFELSKTSSCDVCDCKDFEEDEKQE